ncbi:Pheromone B beta 1 receptor [Mycena venus]|uniref:Pheromone B beta 1 receptor n=1 Tax=Mycena venus TaxID=2733690 RepID=A0A8H7CP21_9AGAR|nr:Pheromone B beta 1 receptor [Mycena venus]
MLLVLSILSFLCAGLLTVFLIVLLHRPTVSTSNVAIIPWLLLGKTIHVVNALVWPSNVDTTRIPVWFDIITKLLLGTTAALPGLHLCSARYLELLSSTRKIYPNMYSKRIHKLVDVALCYLLPLLYIILHFAVQNHRFDLVRNFGCSASIPRFTPAVLIIVIPPLIICIILIHIARLSTIHFASHLSTRPSLSAPLFIRHLAKSVLLTVTVLIVTFFSTPQASDPLLTAFYPNFNVIYVVGKPQEVTAAQTSW